MKGLSNSVFAISIAAQILTAQGTGAVSGKISAAGTFLENVGVTIYHLDPKGNGFTGTFATKTDVQGEYRFPSVPQGDYILIAMEGGERVFQGEVMIAGNSEIKKDIVIATGSRVVIYAPKGGYSVGIKKPSIYVNGIEYARIANGTFFYIDVSPGNLTVCAEKPNKGCISKTIQSGEISYVQTRYPPVKVKLAFMSAAEGEQERKNKASLPIPSTLVVKKDSVLTDLNLR
jgi:hypothetical protein